jgi:hypothetical protein
MDGTPGLVGSKEKAEKRKLEEKENMKTNITVDHAAMDNGTTDNGNKDRGTANGSSVRDGVRRLGEKEWMRRAVAKVAAEEWWAKASTGQRVLAMTVARMMHDLLEEDRRAEGERAEKRIEIRVEAGAVRARFIHLLKQPEAGCLSAIVLPEAPSGGWN